ncbi:unnamed protein product [Echinostoma caproni]|uniref:GT23 domain-containing protein n=1 Tax=Echinostoma caproni TaxID=27848 RepID=A0A183AF81_9TREM|nr:unnamed protein product [Echinostoma caproni]
MNAVFQPYQHHFYALLVHKATTNLITFSQTESIWLRKQFLGLASCALCSEWVDDVFAEPRLQAKPTKRRVYLATDEPKLFKEASESYPDYEFIGDPERAETASVFRRSQADSVAGIALDILALSKTDFLVCTFSSQVCRVAYELMQARHGDLGDASDRVQSLDDIYYFGGQQPSPFETIIADESNQLQPGDRVSMAGNHWDGYAKVTPVKRTDAILVPAYKFQPGVDIFYSRVF